MKHPDHIKFVINGKVYFSWPEIEQQCKNKMFAENKPDAIVKCFDYDTDELLDESPLNVIFCEPNN